MLNMFLFIIIHIPIDQLITCEWMHDPDNGYNDTMVWLPAEVEVCSGYILIQENIFKNFFTQLFLQNILL